MCWIEIAKLKFWNSNSKSLIYIKNGIKSKSEVFAVIMETIADISVIKSSDTSPDWSLFDDIRDNEILVTAYDNGIEQQSRVDVFSK